MYQGGYAYILKRQSVYLKVYSSSILLTRQEFEIEEIW